MGTARLEPTTANMGFTFESSTLPTELFGAEGGRCISDI